MALMLPVSALIIGHWREPRLRLIREAQKPTMGDYTPDDQVSLSACDCLSGPNDGGRENDAFPLCLADLCIVCGLGNGKTAPNLLDYSEHHDGHHC